MLQKTKNEIKAGIHKARIYRNTHGKNKFINRTHGKKYGCIVLAGYKKILWDSVFPRLYKYIPDNIDVLVVSSGLFDTDLKKICEEYNWSYLSTKKNNLCLAQNLAIKSLPEAEYIFKLDEDMFVTRGFFEDMIQKYNSVSEKGRYDIGFVAPLIPINGYCYIKLLERFGELERFESVFGKAKYTCGNHDKKNFTKDPKIPPYLWSQTNMLKDIDATAEMLRTDADDYSVCPFRFSIGAIFFKRKIWTDMGMFDVNHTTGMALDEIKLCQYCNTNSLAIIVSHNSFVGHLAYGPQMDSMIEYYKANKHQFLA